MFIRKLLYSSLIIAFISLIMFRKAEKQKIYQGLDTDNVMGLWIGISVGAFIQYFIALIISWRYLG